jgi:non-specific serine/threonine protein kinase
MNDTARQPLRFLDYTIAADVDLLYRGSTVVALEPRPVQVLRYLAEHHDRVVSKQELLDRVWPDVFTTDSVLKRAVSQCRHALGDDPNAPSFIETHHGRGYRFIAPVERAPAPEPSAAAPEPPAAPAPELPHEATSFVGRERDLEELDRLVAGSRLVTLTGPGGIGKTRLALHFARRAASSFRDGACMVELESLSDPALVPATVAAALGVSDAPRHALVDAIAERIRDRDLLIVLDNCEHLVEACADLAGRLLRATSRPRVLATSREPLAVAGEAIWNVRVLDGAEAARLFADRARAIVPDFALDDANRAGVASICRRLEGIPLAIELAAARARALSVDEIDARLGDRFRLLTRGDRTAPARRQTLRAAIDWSYDLLTEGEQALLRRLSVFAGGFDLDGAASLDAELGADGEDALDVLSRLVDKSLVVAVERPEGMRYRLLDTIRQYAAARLEAAGETARAEGALGRWAVTLVEQAERAARGPREKVGLAQLEVEHDNLREALRWGRDVGRDDVFVARMCRALARFWDMHGHWDEGREWLEETLARAEGLPADLRAGMTFGAGMLARHQSDTGRSEALLVESIRVFRELGDEAMTARGLNALGNLFEACGWYDRAVATQQECLEIYERIGDDLGRAMALSGLGMLALDVGDYDRAAGYYEESLVVSRRTGDLGSVGIMLHNLGEIASRRGEHARARALLEESIDLAAELGFKSLAAHSLLALGDVSLEEGHVEEAEAFYGDSLSIVRDMGDRGRFAFALDGFARAAAARGEAERALVLAGAADALREPVGFQLNPAEREARDRSLASAREVLGDEASRAYDAGTRLRAHEAIAYATSAGHR